MKIIRTGIDPNAVKKTAIELSAAKFSPLIAGMSAATGYSLGEHDQYLPSIFTADFVCKMDFGKSLVAFSPTGSGKTIAMEHAAKAASEERKVVILTNRKACKKQLLRDFGKMQGLDDIPDNLLDRVKLSENIEVMTYQQFARKRFLYQGKKLVLFLDECHCFAEDAVFAEYPQQVISYLRNNLDNTIRIYMTATPDAVMSQIWELEALSDAAYNLKPLTPETYEECLCGSLKEDTRIQHIFLMKSDWDYLTFRFYSPDKREDLLEKLKTYQDEAQKCLIYLNDIKAGAELQEMIGEGQHIYSVEEKQAEIAQIVLNEQFEENSLITTKVAENGLSLHDPNLTVIVAETHDPIALQQIIGRARVNRKKPREIEVLIPDYTTSELGRIYGMLCMQIKKFENAHNDPHMAMAQNQSPYVYYDPKQQRPVVNDLGMKELQRQIDFVHSLREEEAKCPHAFARHILGLYNKPADNIEAMHIGYSNDQECKNRVVAAWIAYKASSMSENDLATLKTALAAACNETGAYGKELKDSMQIGTINKILTFAGVKETIKSGEMIYGIDTEEA